MYTKIEVAIEPNRPKLPHTLLKLAYDTLQGDQLHMAVCFWYLVTCLVYDYTVVYIVQVTFCKVPEQHGNVVTGQPLPRFQCLTPSSS